MNRATWEAYFDEHGFARERFWVWRQGRRRYSSTEPGPQTAANKRRNRRKMFAG